MNKNKFLIVGRRVANVDAWEKVTGSAKYTVDMVLPNMLHGKILRSPHPHARIMGIDTHRAEELPGVKIVLTGKDTLGVKNGIWRSYRDLCDEEILCREKVRYVGDAVATLAATTKEIAEEALHLIDVEYEVLPAAFDPLDAMQAGMPEIHEGFERNLNVYRQIEWGDVDEAFKECDHIREDTFHCSSQAHACLEPHCAIASFSHDGKLTVWTSTQSNYYTQLLLSDMTGLREGDIKVIKPHVGGGFGGKLSLDSAQYCASLLSMKLKRPVKIVLSRPEEFAATKRRTPIHYQLKLGAMKDGRIVARKVRAITEGGAYTALGGTAIYLTGFFSSFPYKYDNYQYDGFRVYTNNETTSACRGFGAPQANFVSESQIDMMAEDLGIDPVQFRLKNAMTPNHVIPEQATILSCEIKQCLGAIDKWIKSRGLLPPNHGIGISAYGFMSGGIFNWIDTPYAFAAAMVKINVDGKVDLFTGANEIGQGSNTTLCMICAEELGVRLEDITLHTGDTSTCPVDLGAWGSRQTLMSGNAVKMAAAEAKRQLLEVAFHQLKPNVIYDLDIKDRWVHLVERPYRRISYFDVVKDAVRGKEGNTIIGHGHYTPHGKGMVSPAYSFGVQAVEVSVDTETGKVDLIHIATAHECGQVINPIGLEGQVEGASIMAAGWVLTEDLQTRNGKILNDNFRDYKLLLACDVPEMSVIEVDSYEPEGPYGAKEAGEGLTIPGGAAIANAIYNAVGVRITDMPITPEKIIRALEGKLVQEEEEKKQLVAGA
ncbi:MAG: molybdopterin-dependent oxidoreductase [Syntrophorhabdus aromaticivorans]|uniref:Molybdopterin-dependent oxidoreductase n=1 Tax=Syntrophorhabdus aromaticivorans TaxID=328301 RepID=A0A971RZ51_9BACT|nr:molybdopterin-dependent oxidoreductase [Syntrophorhabdus aromaticivorans]